MHSTITSLSFQNKVKGKYKPDYIEVIIEKIAMNPRIGKKFTSVNNTFKFDIGFSSNKKTEYSLVYFYKGRNNPIFIVDIYKKKEKDLLSKVISSLINETITE